MLGGFGWQREDMKLVQQMAATGAEPIGSLGYDGPLACPLARAPEPGRLLQGVGGGGDQPGDRPRARGRALLVPGGVRRAARHRRGPGRRAPPSRRPSRSSSAATTGSRRSATPTTARSRASTRPTCSRTSGRSSAAARAVLDLSCLESEGTRGAIERLKHEATGGGARRAPSCSCCRTAPPTRATAATSTRTWRWRPWTWRCASTSSGRARPTCAAAAGWCCARPPCATCTT